MVNDIEVEKLLKRRWLFYPMQMILSFGQNLSFQYLPIFNRKLGATESQMGLMTAIQNVFSTFFSPYFGKKSDIHGRRLYLMLGGLFAFISAIAITVAKNPNQIIFAVGVNAFGLSIITPAWSGAQADISLAKERGGFIGRLFGVGSGFVTIALGIYAFISPHLPLNEIENYRLIMGISAINFGLIVLLSWFFIDVKAKRKIEISSSLITPLYDPIFRRFIIIILFWWISMSFAWSYFPIVLSDILSITPAQVAWLGLTQTIVQSISSYKFADLIDRIGARKSLIIGFLSFTFVPFFFAIATEWWQILIPQMIAGIGIGFGFTALQVYILNQAGSDRAGNYQGFYNVSWGVVTFFGSLIGGMFLQWYVRSTGDLVVAIRNLLLIIAALRALSNILMYKYLPHVESND